jgi:hypothetical protein
MNAMEHSKWKRYIFCCKGRIFLCPQSNLNKKILRDSNDSLMIRHSGFFKAYQRIKKVFFLGRSEEGH